MKTYQKTSRWLTLLLLFLSLHLHAQFVQQGSKLVNAALALDGGQGASVDISDDGNTAIIGVPKDGTTGGALIYVRTSGSWAQQGPKLSGAGYVIGQFTGLSQGTSVAISGDGNTVAIGDPNDNDFLGAVYIFVRSGTSWTQQGSKLTASGLTSVSGQGAAVDLSDDGNRLVVGAPLIYIGNSANKGGAYVYQRTGTSWVQQGIKLYSSPTSSYAPKEGTAVAISGDGTTIVVGAPGRSNVFNDGGVFFYAFSGSSWSNTNGFSGEGNLGAAVGLNANGTIAIVGQPGLTSNNGAASIFTLRGIWESSTTLIGTNAGGKFNQGESVSISADGSRVAIGGGGNYNLKDLGLGQAWIFNKSGLTWTEDITKYQGSGAIGNARQGIAIAISGNGKDFIVGGSADDGGKGAAWIFTYQPPLPTISDFTPKKATKGASVTITGTNLSNVASVSFGGVPATSITTNTATSITAIVGDCAAGNVKVTTSAGDASKGGFSCSTTGGPEHLAEPASIRFYPNPAQSQVTVEFSEPVARAANAILYDPLGRVVIQQDIPHGATMLSLDLASLPAGLYLLQLSHTAHRLKFIKE